MNNEKYNVTVIVCTYNPIWEKYKLTLLSIIFQKNIKIELLICDDGSQNSLIDNAICLMKKHDFHDFKYIASSQNEGTVKNIYKGYLASNGEYVYSISPGDFFYSELALKNIYDFAKTNGYETCFGEAVYYSKIDSCIKLASVINSSPKNPNIFSDQYNLNKKKSNFFFNYGHILGATIFRKRDLGIYYLEKIVNVCKYVEDNTIIAMQIYDGSRIGYLKEYLVFYEHGTGVSTNSSSKWLSILANDFINAYKMMLKEYKDDYFLKIMIMFMQTPNKHNRLKNIINMGPTYLFRYFYYKYILMDHRSVKANSNPIDYKYFKMLQGEL